MFKTPIRIIVAAAALSSSMASAQLPGQFNTLPPPADAQGMLGYQPGQQNASGPPSCPKLCPADNSPCDPIYMKDADGRCDDLSGSLGG